MMQDISILKKNIKQSFAECEELYKQIYDAYQLIKADVNKIAGRKDKINDIVSDIGTSIWNLDLFNEEVSPFIKAITRGAAK